MVYMVFGAILAGGIGSRMKLADMPKQFLPLGSKPIIIHTVEKFLANARFDKVLVGINGDWELYFNDLLKKHGVDDERLAVVVGGKVSGVFGIILFIPLFSVIYALVRRSVYSRLRRKGITISE